MESLLDSLQDNVLFIILVALAIIVLIREIVCWYWKINDRYDLQYREYLAAQEIIELQKEQIILLKTMIAKMDQGDSGNVDPTDS